MSGIKEKRIRLTERGYTWSIGGEENSELPRHNFGIDIFLDDVLIGGLIEKANGVFIRLTPESVRDILLPDLLDAIEVAHQIIEGTFE